MRRRMEKKERERHLANLSFSHPSSPSSASLPLSLLLHPPPHYLSLSFLPILILAASRPPSSSLLLSLLVLLFLLPFSLILTASLPLPLNHHPHYFSSLIPLHPLPHYLSPSFLSVILTTSLPPSSSSLHISLLTLLFLLPLSHFPLLPTHCLSPSFLSILLLTTSPPSFL